MDGQFDGVVHQHAFVVGWPSGVNDAARCATALSQFFCDVGCEGAEKTGELIGLAGGQCGLVARCFSGEVHELNQGRNGRVVGQSFDVISDLGDGAVQLLLDGIVFF